MSTDMRSAPNRWWALVVLALTELVITLDVTIVTIALPQAQADLGLSDGERQWVITAYALAFGALLLLGGRIADFWGRKRTFMVGMIGFGATSVWGGLAQSGTELVVARGLQGAFGALLAPAALAMVTVLFQSGRERGIAFAVFGTIAGSGAAVGLVLGGVLTEFASWRWCLLVNIFFVGVSLIAGAFLLRESKAEGDTSYDIIGTVVITLGLGSLVYGFTRAEHGWGEADTIGFLIAGVLLTALFVWLQNRSANPLLPMRVLTNKIRAGAFLVQAAVGAVMIGSILFLALHLQIVLEMSPLVSGLAIAAMTAMIFIATPPVTQSMLKSGPRPILIAGPILTALGLFYLAGISPGGSYWVEVFPALVLMAVGLAMLFVPLQNLALTGVDPHDAGVASATVMSTFHIGGAIGLAVFTAINASGADGAFAAGAEVDDALTSGYIDVFIASGVLMLAATVLSIALIRGTKDELMPQGDEMAYSH